MRLGCATVGEADYTRKRYTAVLKKAEYTRNTETPRLIKDLTDHLTLGGSAERERQEEGGKRC